MSLKIIALFLHSFRIEFYKALYGLIPKIYHKSFIKHLQSLSRSIEVTFFSFSNIECVGFLSRKNSEKPEIFSQTHTHTATSLFSQKIPLSIDMQTSSCKDDDGDERCRKNCTDFNHIPLLPPPYMHVKVYTLIK